MPKCKVLYHNICLWVSWDILESLGYHRGIGKGIFVMWSTYGGYFEFDTLRIVIMTLDIDQVQIIEFESITFSSRTHGLCVDPKPSSNPLRMELLAYKKDIVSISIFVITLPTNLGSTIPSLHGPSNIPIARKRPSTMLMWTWNWPMGWRQQIDMVTHGKKTKNCK